MTALAVASRAGDENERIEAFWTEIDSELLATLSWDSQEKILTFPIDHPHLGWTPCVIPDCDMVGQRTALGLCGACKMRWNRTDDLSLEEFLQVPRVFRRVVEGPAPCVVPDCERPWKSGKAQLCDAHDWQRTRTLRVSMEEFLGRPDVQPLPSFGPCAVAACPRDRTGRGPHCKAHAQRFSSARKSIVDVDLWNRIEPAIAETGKVSLRGLHPQVVAEVIFAIQDRVESYVRVDCWLVRALCNAAREHQVTSVEDLAVEELAANPRKFWSIVVTAARRCGITPETERHKDQWNLRAFGHRGTLDFTAITQPWLREATKRWAADDMPQRRGRNVGSTVRDRVNSVIMLAESLRVQRDDKGVDPTALSRQDITAFCNRLAYLTDQGTISANRRLMVSRHTRFVLRRMRTMGIRSPGEPLDGLPDDFMLLERDIPDEPEDTETGRDLPAEVLEHLCAHLEVLEEMWSSDARASIELMIDTGRRPDEICKLPLDCLKQDSDGKPILVYDNIKSNRPGRELPIGAATATIIVDQQQRVRTRFPNTPTAELKLFPSAMRNPRGHKAVTPGWITQRHRDWVERIPECRVPTQIVVDGTSTVVMLPFPKLAIVPYAYRHSYAQRHADAGVDVTVLMELMDHRQLTTTQGYYTVSKERRRDAVDRVTTMQYDRHGNRVWRQVQGLLDSERARRAVGEVAVPYGGCSEPSNVAASGQDCPVRFRCIGCGHFGTDVSYLPDLERYLSDLLRHRERLRATMDADEWARSEAMPSDEEIGRIRRLIDRMKGDLDQLTEEERAQVEDATTIVRRGRGKIVGLGMPRVRQPLPDVRPKRSA